MGIILVSDEARRIDKFVQEHLDFSLDHTFLLIITIILEEQKSKFYQIAQRLNHTGTITNIDENGAKASFNYHKKYIEQAIFQATQKQVKLRKNAFKTTINRYLFAHEDDLLGKLEGCQKEIFILLSSREVSEDFKHNYRYSVIQICNQIIAMCNQDNN